MRSAPAARLSDAHIPAAYALSSMAGWNQTRDDWQRLLDLSDACYGIEVQGELIATATLICYGRTLGWVGMVLTHPDFRRLGYARTLVAEVMRYAAQVRIPTVKLDATDDGLPLYESFGFRAEQPVERRWRGPREIAESTPADLGTPLFELDADSCGYDRSHLLTGLAAEGGAALKGEGYVLDRTGRLNRYLGPCVAATPGAARSLITRALSRHPDDGWLWDLLPANKDAVAIACELGFGPVRKLTRMVWGKELRGNPERIFAIGGLELG